MCSSDLCSNRVETVKLSDFGASKKLPASGLIKRVVGTEVYSPPEVVLPSTDLVDGRKADIWSLGILFHALFTGTWPFSATTPETLRLHLAAGKVTLSAVLSPAERSFLEPCLHQDPSLRPTIEQVLASFPNRSPLSTPTLSHRLVHRFLGAFRRTPSPNRRTDK